MNLREYLRLTRQTEKEAADDLKVKQPVFNRWVNGTRIPNPGNMAAIFNWSNGVVTPNDFYPLGTKKP